MTDCCESKEETLGDIGRTHRQVLWVALFLNAAMFLIEQIYGWIAHSTSLQGDAIDMFADAFAYGLSLAALSQGNSAKRRAALWKGYSLAGLGISVLLVSVYRACTGAIPEGETITWIGALALSVNLICAWILFRHREDDINMRSVWICSRNDVLANLAVVVAGFGVMRFQILWPDLIAGVGIAALQLKSAWGIIGSVRADRAACGASGAG